jgi:hypothetical protein
LEMSESNVPNMSCNDGAGLRGSMAVDVLHKVVTVLVSRN